MPRGCFHGDSISHQVNNQDYPSHHPIFCPPVSLPALLGLVARISLFSFRLVLWLVGPRAVATARAEIKWRSLVLEGSP